MPNNDDVTSRTRMQRFMDIAITVVITSAFSSFATVKVMEYQIGTLKESIQELKNDIRDIKNDFYTPRFNNNSPQSKQLWQPKTDTTSQ